MSFIEAAQPFDELTSIRALRVEDGVLSKVEPLSINAGLCLFTMMR